MARAKAKAPMAEDAIAKLEPTITKWFKVKQQLDKLMVEEKNLRLEIFNVAFPAPERGTNKIKISHGMALVGDYRLNYKVDRALLDNMLSDPEAEPLIREVIDFRPGVRAGEWEKMSDNEKKILAPMITETPGTPGLDVKPQNKVRW